MKKSLFTMLAAVISGVVFLTSCASEGTADKYGLEQTNAGKTEILLSGSVEKKETKQNEGNSVNADTEKRYPDGTLNYSNLTGEAVRNEVKEILSIAGIPENQIEKVFEWVKDYNSCMGSCENFDFSCQKDAGGAGSAASKRAGFPNPGEAVGQVSGRAGV